MAFSVVKRTAFALLFFKIVVIASSLIWASISHTYPEADQKAVSWVAWLTAQDNFLFFEHGKYMRQRKSPY